MASNKLLTGVIPALVTPFKADGSVNVAAVDPLVKFHIDAGSCGFYLCGSTGEGLACSLDERKAMTAATMAAVGKYDSKLPVVVMVAAGTAEDAVNLAVHAESVGASAVSSVVPPDAPGNIDAAVEYWTKIAGATKLPFYLYWIAATADQDTTPEAFIERMQTVPNFAGFKFTDKNFYKFQQLMACGEKIGVNGVTGPDEMMVAGFIMGSDGAIGSTYNVYPKLAIRAYKSFLAGDNKQATACQAAMNKIINILLSKFPRIQTGLKIIYKEKYGIDCGTTKAATAAPPTAEQTSGLMAALEGCVWE